jgi:hypothetical protein
MNQPEQELLKAIVSRIVHESDENDEDTDAGNGEYSSAINDIHELALAAEQLLNGAKVDEIDQHVVRSANQADDPVDPDEDDEDEDEGDEEEEEDEDE